jgi:hypothetical protein
VLIVRNINTTQPQRSTRRQPVRIVPNSHTHAQSRKSLSTATAAGK